MESTHPLLEEELESLLSSLDWTDPDQNWDSAVVNRVYDEGYAAGSNGDIFDCFYVAKANRIRYIWGYLDGVGDHEASVRRYLDDA